MNPQSSQPQIKDKFERPLSVGDWVVFAYVNYRSARLDYGQVTRTFFSTSFNGNPEPKVTIKVIRWGDPKKVTISNIQNIMMVPQDMVPMKFQKKLEGEDCDDPNV
jgi:hypothetical protein